MIKDEQKQLEEEYFILQLPGHAPSLEEVETGIQDRDLKAVIQAEAMEE